MALRCCATRRPGSNISSVLISSRRRTPVKSRVQRDGVVKVQGFHLRAVKREVGDFCGGAGGRDHAAGMGFDQEINNAPAKVAGRTGNKQGAKRGSSRHGGMLSGLSWNNSKQDKPWG